LPSGSPFGETFDEPGGVAGFGANGSVGRVPGGGVGGTTAGPLVNGIEVLGVTVPGVEEAGCCCC